jgi:TldD protein
VDVNIDLGAVLKRTLRNGGEFADVFIEQSAPLSLMCEDNRIEKVMSGVDVGAGVRLIFGQRTAYAYTNELTTGSLLEIADAVGQASSGDIRQPVISLTRANPRVDLLVRQAPEGVNTSLKVAMVLQANKVARAFDPRVRQAMVSYRENRQRVLVANSDGVLAEDERMYLTAVVHVVAADGEMVQTGYEPIGGIAGMEIFDAYPLETAAVTAARRAVMMLSARKAPAGRMPVVLSADAGDTMIHEAIGHGLEADLAQSGLSVYSNRRGELIASSLITVVDDATLAGKRGSFRFDDEGVAAERTVLVDKGILKTFM